MRVTVLIENSLGNRSDLKAEHGLSLHIAYGNLRILFDLGMSGSFARNASLLGIDPAAVDQVVLSHHHVDHTGGLDRFFQLNTMAPVWLKPWAGERHYFRPLAPFRKDVGLPRRPFDRHADRSRFVDDTTEIAPGVVLITHIGRRHPLPAGNRSLFITCDGRIVPDTFDHELLLVVSVLGGLVVFTGCSHNGILNMVDTVVTTFPGIPIKALFGGFHLIAIPFLNGMAASTREVEEMGEGLLRYPVEKIYTGHCTGTKAFGLLERVLGEKLGAMHTGAGFDIPDDGHRGGDNDR